VHFHVLEDVRGDLVVLAEFDQSETLNVFVAPGQLVGVTHGHGFTRDVLHDRINSLGSLAIINGFS